MDQGLNKSEKSLEITIEPPEKLNRTASRETFIVSNPGMSSQLVDSISAVWKFSSTNNFGSSEAQDFLRLQEAEEKLAQAHKVFQSLRKKLTASEKDASELKVSLEKETTLNESLKNRSVSALQLTESFTQHINYINDTLARTKENAQVLEDTYSNQIVSLLEDKENLTKKLDELKRVYQSEDEKYKEKLEQTKLEIEQIKIDNTALNDEILKLKEETSKAKKELTISDETIANMKMNQDVLKNKVNELRHRVNEQENKKINVTNIIEGDKIKEIKEYYEKKLSLARKELNDSKSQLDILREEQEENLQSYKEKEKLVDNLEKNIETFSLQVTEVKNKTDRANLDLQRVNEENVIFKKKIDEKKHDLSTVEDKLVSITSEKSNLADKINSLKEKMEKGKEEKNKLIQKLEEKKNQLIELEQLQTNTAKDLKDYQGSKDSKEMELQKKLKNLKERKEKADIENWELKEDKQKLERDHEKNLKAQADQYNACVSNLDKEMILNNKLAAELADTKNTICIRETFAKNLIAKMAQDTKEIETKLKTAQELLTKKNDSENQLKKEKIKLETIIREFKESFKQLEEDNDNATKLQKSQSNLEPRVKTPVKLKIGSSQSRSQPTQDEQQVQTPKPSPAPRVPPKSPTQKLTTIPSSDSDDDETISSYKFDRLIKNLQISPRSPSTPEKFLPTSPSPGTPKWN